MLERRAATGRRNSNIGKFNESPIHRVKFERQTPRGGLLALARSVDRRQGCSGRRALCQGPPELSGWHGGEYDGHTTQPLPARALPARCLLRH